jgi:hypothetical protein
VIGTDLLPPTGSKFGAAFGHLDTLAKSRLTVEKISIRHLRSGKKPMRAARNTIDLRLPVANENAPLGLKVSFLAAAKREDRP